MEQSKTWEIVEFLDNQFNPLSIRRLSDGVVFKLEDHVTNGSRMQGLIKKFELHQGVSLYVYTDWSNIGMGIEDIQFVEAPGTFSDGQVVHFELPTTVNFGSVFTVEGKTPEHSTSGGTSVVLLTATIRGIHLYKGKIKYDLDLWLHGNSSTRIYNVDAKFVKKA